MATVSKRSAEQTTKLIRFKPKGTNLRRAFVPSVDDVGQRNPCERTTKEEPIVYLVATNSVLIFHPVLHELPASVAVEASVLITLNCANWVPGQP
jgi:hypothetical protein